jgi:Zn-dependent M16 (insulinase) family peptidase
VYRASGDALRRAAAGDFENYVIGAVAMTEPYLAPSGEMEFAASRAMSGRTEADTQRMRSEMLHTTRDRLMSFADEVDAVSRSRSVCVIGGKEQIDACSSELDSVEPVLAD